MRAVVQRVFNASVQVDEKTVGSIAKGLVVFLGVDNEDTDADINYLADKIANLRVFEDENGKMNKSILDASGELLLVSQFTICGDCRKGRRPNFSQAAAPDRAKQLYLRFAEYLNNLSIHVETGVFQAYMKVNLINDGPVTLILDSKKNF